MYARLGCSNLKSTWIVLFWSVCAVCTCTLHFKNGTLQIISQLSVKLIKNHICLMLNALNEFKWNAVTLPKWPPAAHTHTNARIPYAYEIILGCELLCSRFVCFTIFADLPLCNVRITHRSTFIFMCVREHFTRPEILRSLRIVRNVPKNVLLSSNDGILCITCIVHSQSIIRFLQQLKPQFIKRFHSFSLSLCVYKCRTDVYQPRRKIDHLAKIGLHCLIKFWPRNKNYTEQ